MLIVRGSLIKLEILRRGCQVGNFASCRVAQRYGWMKRWQIFQRAKVLIGRRKECCCPRIDGAWSIHVSCHWHDLVFQIRPQRSSSRRGRYTFDVGSARLGKNLTYEAKSTTCKGKRTHEWNTSKAITSSALLRDVKANAGNKDLCRHVRKLF